MGKRGPQKTPLKVLEARGSWRAKLNNDAPEATGEPICPAWLSAEAKKTWKEVLPILTGMGVVGSIDAVAIAQYCVALECYMDAYKSQNAKEIKDWAVELRRAERELGMTPSSRAGIKVEKPKKAESKTAKYFG